MTTATASSLASKLRGFSEKLKQDAKSKFASRETNTPKKARLANVARHEGLHFERAAQIADLLAAKLDAGEETEKSLKERLGTITKKLLLDATKRRVMPCLGYYEYGETDEFSDKSDAGKWLQSLLAPPDPETIRKAKIAKAEEDLRFSNIPGFFPTPLELANKLMTRLELHPYLRDGDVGTLDQVLTVLEPSAGKGDLVEAVRRANPNTVVEACEFNYKLRELLMLKGISVIGDDFLTHDFKGKKYDRIVMNPPFEKMADAEHVQKAYSLLAPGGILVAIMSPGPFNGQIKKAVSFREFLEAIPRDAGGDVHVEDVAAGAFKSAFVSTGVACKIVTICRGE